MPLSRKDMSTSSNPIFLETSQRLSTMIPARCHRRKRSLFPVHLRTLNRRRSRRLVMFLPRNRMFLHLYILEHIISIGSQYSQSSQGSSWSKENVFVNSPRDVEHGAEGPSASESDYLDGYSEPYWTCGSGSSTQREGDCDIAVVSR